MYELNNLEYDNDSYGTLVLYGVVMKAIITVGIPASGKSTWANQYCLLENSNAVQINRDDIRADLFNNGFPIEWDKYKFTKAKENRVTDEAWKRVLNAAAAEKDIVISDTNLNTDRLIKLISNLEAEGFVCEIKEFPISFEEACKRDASRKNGVGYSVIARMYDSWCKYKGLDKLYDEFKDATKPDAYLVDIDGTLAIMKDRSPFDWHKVGQDDVNSSVANVVRALHKAGHKIIILSGRDSICKEETVNWLNDCKIPFDDIFMRYEGDYRQDVVIKEELLKYKVLPTYNVLGVFDDRPSVCRMWRSLGLEVFQIGNPYVEF